MTQLFSQAQLEAIAGALGDTEEGLRGQEIVMLIAACKMVDPGEITKWQRIYNALAEAHAGPLRQGQGRSRVSGGAKRQP
ncbi:hypothetical protein [Ancylobacter defluvii]|uniref:Uncharacterized protein n=1 Tax=Ancylobacter defluvii TaxID=1282440 RepID=A0A9W6JUI7_9HYPH|nr:hypothetical protein [Ancylobacter defluvii]MBS7590222.1 hypothetical protein [Ancylobacter defluvii]GLK82866.1 hypothetical protein GCM10017653_09350 [Ancylobacter defluvii]